MYNGYGMLQNYFLRTILSKYIMFSYTVLWHCYLSDLPIVNIIKYIIIQYILLLEPDLFPDINLWARRYCTFFFLEERSFSICHNIFSSNCNISKLCYFFHHHNFTLLSEVWGGTCFEFSLQCIFYCFCFCREVIEQDGGQHVILI